MNSHPLIRLKMTEQTPPQIKHGSLGLAIKANDVEDAKAIVALLQGRREWINTEQWTELLFKTLDTLEPETAAYLKEQGADITASITAPMSREEGREQTYSLGYAAVMANNKKLVEWMIAEKWIDEKMLSPAGDTLLVQAVREHAFDVAELLLESGMSVDYQNLRGVCALHEAASQGDYLAMEWLMERHANPTLETMSGAVPCELVPEQADDPAEADKLFEAVDSYMVEYRETKGKPFVPQFIVAKANEIRKAMEPPRDENAAPSPPSKKISVKM